MKASFLIPLLLLSFNCFAQQISYNYICPVPGSKYLNPEQVICLKTGQCFDPNSLHHTLILIKGSQSGIMLCEVSLSPDLMALFITPNSKFALGEKVDVWISPGLRTCLGKNIKPEAFSFFVREQKVARIYGPGVLPGEPTAETHSGLKKSSQSSGERENNLPPDYPAPAVMFTSSGAAPGCIFFTPTVRLTPQFQKYITIWDNYGTPLFYQKVSKTVTDFKVLDPADGILTYAVNGLQNPEQDCYYLMDSNYDIFDSVRAGNGYNIDNHDILLLENGHFLILIYDPQAVNMSLVVPGGNPNATVTGLVIQEVDINRNVYFQWRSWDHFEITDATWDIDLTSMFIDYVHANALELDNDGNILVSSRHLDEITKIDFATGDMIWRFGLLSENNQFTFTNDPVGFSHQHDIRKLSNGNYTVYDNGNLHLEQVSRALEYHIDENAMQATLVWSYQHDPAVFAPMTGSNQRLPNGNRLIGWGSVAPLAFTEVNAANQVVLEFHMPDSVTGYRARKYNWETTVFSAPQSLAFGNYEGYSGLKNCLLLVTNLYTETIQITSAHHRFPGTFSVSGLPVTIMPGETAELTVYFQPEAYGTFSDVLTLNYDNFNNTRRIARQINLAGLWDPSLPSILFDPVNGSVGADPSEPVSVIFSEPVSKLFGQELTDADVPNIFDFFEENEMGSFVSFHGTVNASKTQITIYPDNPLKENQQYYVRLKPNLLQDLQGNPVNYPEHSYFSTGFYVSLPDDYPTDGILIGPNPARNLVRISSDTDLIRTVDIYNASGQWVRRSDPFDHHLSLRLDEFPEGMILLRIVTGTNETIYRKVMISE